MHNPFRTDTINIPFKRIIPFFSPAAFNVEETIGTLRFAARAKLIKNVIKVAPAVPFLTAFLFCF
jgi:hypothetical protein